ncbi:MAG: zinc ribbon domain-containing protein [Pseudobacteriovorax sp.]|nr:zinc ribbon domain-containing protein [Pseudobacteriovorax sp.]
MPRYEYLCGDCGYAEVFQMKYQDKGPDCPRCGSSQFIKQISLFGTVGLSQKSTKPPVSRPQAQAKSQTKPHQSHSGSCDSSQHEHSHGSKPEHSRGACQGHDHGHKHEHSSGHSCSKSNVDNLIKTYEKTARPVEIKK